jgi:hypothetical protein
MNENQVDARLANISHLINRCHEKGGQEKIGQGIIFLQQSEGEWVDMMDGADWGELT